MATCLCDAFFDEAAKASVQVLEYLGCDIDFPEGQTCCGQPAFNAGDWESSRKVVRHMAKTFQGENPIVSPSGSCTAMSFHGALLEFENEPDLPQIDQVASRSWEFADYVVNGLGVSAWPGSFPHRIAFHRSCHSRGTPSGEAAIQLLKSIGDLEMVAFGEGEQCCGFGGAFSVSHPNISAKMGHQKLDCILSENPEYIVSGDMGCLLHLGGIADKSRGRQPSRLHIAQVLRDALVNAGEIEEY